MARKFLYLIAGIIVALFALMVVLRLWSDDLTELAFVPNGAFNSQSAQSPEAWNDPSMWVAHPGLKDDPSQWLPAGITAPAQKLPVAVFFIHPTSFVERDRWNGPMHGGPSADKAALMVKGMASPFNAAQALWAPRYRQATIGAFLTDKPEATQALDLAYADVLAAFDTFLRHVEPGQSIALAGHSQGAFHLRRLLRDRIANTSLAKRIVGAWVIGWPVSLNHDLPKMGLPACEKPQDTGCVLSWLSVANPAETDMLIKAYDRRIGLDGKAVTGSPFLCTNPLTGISNSSSAPAIYADASANLGTLIPNFATGGGTLMTRVVPAGCGPDHFLHIGEPPKLDLGPYVLPGNNYHLYDVTLFWANLRADFERRSAAWQKKQAK